MVPVIPPPGIWTLVWSPPLERDVLTDSPLISRTRESMLGRHPVLYNPRLGYEKSVSPSWFLATHSSSGTACSSSRYRSVAHGSPGGVVRSRAKYNHLPKLTGASFEAESSAPVLKACSPGQQLDCKLEECSDYSHLLKHFQIPEPQKLWDNKCSLLLGSELMGNLFPGIDNC